MGKTYILYVHCMYEHKLYIVKPLLYSLLAPNQGKLKLKSTHKIINHGRPLKKRFQKRYKNQVDDRDGGGVLCPPPPSPSTGIVSKFIFVMLPNNREDQYLVWENVGARTEILDIYSRGTQSERAGDSENFTSPLYKPYTVHRTNVHWTVNIFVARCSVHCTHYQCTMLIFHVNFNILLTLPAFYPPPLFFSLWVWTPGIWNKIFFNSKWSR